MSYVTLSGFKTFGGFDYDTEDVLLQDILDSATTVIDEYTGRTFAADSVSSRTFTKTVNVPSRFSGTVLFLDEDLADEATHITDSPTVRYLPENDTPYYGIVITEDAWAYPTVTVSGYWGYSKTPSATIQQACLRLAKWLYDMRNTNRGDAVVITPEGQVLLPQGLPQDVITILAPYRKLRVF